MKGAGSRPIPYVSSQDRELEEGEQTIIWLRPKNTKMGAYASRRYTMAMADGTAGDGYDPEEWTEALVDDCCASVVRIDNYAPSDDYVSSHPEVKDQLNENGYFKDPIMDPGMIRDVVYDWMDGVANEIVNVSGNRVRLDAGAKKNLSWSPSLQSGGPLPPRNGDSSTATTA